MLKRPRRLSLLGLETGAALRGHSAHDPIETGQRRSRSARRGRLACEKELVREVTLPNGAKTRTTAFPVSMSNLMFDVYRAPPELGAQTDEVFDEWLAQGDET